MWDRLRWWRGCAGESFGCGDKKGIRCVCGQFPNNFFQIKYLFKRFLLISGYPYPTRNPTRPRVKSPALTVALLQNLRSSCCSSFRSLKCKYMLPRRNTSSLHTESFILIMNKQPCAYRYATDPLSATLNLSAVGGVYTLDFGCSFLPRFRQLVTTHGCPNLHIRRTGCDWWRQRAEVYKGGCDGIFLSFAA